jgi:hypothetical protein
MWSRDGVDDKEKLKPLNVPGIEIRILGLRPVSSHYIDWDMEATFYAWQGAEFVRENAYGDVYRAHYFIALGAVT